MISTAPMTSASTMASTVTVTVLAVHRLCRNVRCHERAARLRLPSVAGVGGASRVWPGSAVRGRLVPAARCVPVVMPPVAPAGSPRRRCRPSAGRSPRAGCPATTIADDPARGTSPRSGRPAPITSSSSLETTSTAVPMSRSCMIRLWMNSIEPTSTPRVGWAAMNSLQRPGHLPGDDHLLLVAAGQRADRRRRRDEVRTSNCSIRSRADAAIASGSSAERVAERRPVVDVQHQVLGDRELLDQPVDAAVLGHVADAGAQDLLGRSCRAGPSPSRRDRAGQQRAQAHDRLDQLGLAVALHARDAEHLAGRARSGRRRRPRGCRGRRRRPGRRPPAPARPARPAAFSTSRMTLAADHQRGQLLLAGVRAWRCRPSGRAGSP